jgi:hypothetical protein
MLQLRAVCGDADGDEDVGKIGDNESDAEAGVVDMVVVIITG